MKSTLLAALAALVATTACGGSPPPKSADEATTAAPASTADMPPPPAATPSTASTAASDTATTPAPSTTSGLRVVALKLVAPANQAKKLGFTTLEVKDDGSVVVDGKPRGKVTSEGLKDDSGKTVLGVSADGAVTGDNTKPAKFSANDELVFENGAKIQVADDGSVLMVDDKGKGDPMPAKFDGVSAWAKREAALIVAAMFLVSKVSTSGPASTPAVTKPAAPKKK
jgi:hypothetical protein